MKEKPLVIHGGGGGLYFMAGLCIFLAYPFFMIAPETLDIGDIIGVTALATIEIALLVSIYFIFVLQKITVHEHHLSYRVLVLRAKIFPKIVVGAIPLKDIQSVTIATIRYLEENSQTFGSKDTLDMIKIYRNLHLPGRMQGGILIPPIPIGFATSWTPLIVITPKSDPSNGITITTKPFSKNSCRKLVAELRRKNVPVTVEERLKF